MKDNSAETQYQPHPKKVHGILKELIHDTPPPYIGDKPKEGAHFDPPTYIGDKPKEGAHFDPPTYIGDKPEEGFKMSEKNTIQKEELSGVNEFKKIESDKLNVPTVEKTDWKNKFIKSIPKEKFNEFLIKK